MKNGTWDKHRSNSGLIPLDCKSSRSITNKSIIHRLSRRILTHGTSRALEASIMTLMFSPPGCLSTTPWYWSPSPSSSFSPFFSLLSSAENSTAKGWDHTKCLSLSHVVFFRVRNPEKVLLIQDRYKQVYGWQHCAYFGPILNEINLRWYLPSVCFVVTFDIGGSWSQSGDVFQYIFTFKFK